MQSIFKFQPLYKARPWGGPAIARLGPRRRLPAGEKIGEAWEITDRPGDESVIADGEFRGKTIRWLLDEHGRAVMGRDWPKGKRFPLLVKILDAAERLSLQVHPPASVAHALGGEPKTEMWYLLEAAPDAALLAGLRRDVTREEFERRLAAVAASPTGPAVQELAVLVPRIPVRKGDAMFIPSGRLHAVDAGCLILEIQQNSDTTYRVFDWGRTGLDGRPREVHVKESLRSIDFSDFEPPVTAARSAPDGRGRPLATCDHFQVEHWRVSRKGVIDRQTAAVLHGTRGELILRSESGEAVTARPGETLLLAAARHSVQPAKEAPGEFVLSLCAR